MAIFDFGRKISGENEKRVSGDDDFRFSRIRRRERRQPRPPTTNDTGDTGGNQKNMCVLSLLSVPVYSTAAFFFPTYLL